MRVAGPAITSKSQLRCTRRRRDDRVAVGAVSEGLPARLVDLEQMRLSTGEASPPRPPDPSSRAPVFTRGASNEPEAGQAELSDSGPTSVYITWNTWKHRALTRPTKHFQKIAARAGLPPIRLHDLRHTNASLALAAGIPLKVVSERLGHSEVSITANLYTYVYPAVGRAAAVQIAGLLRPTPPTVPSDSLAEIPESASEGGTDEHPDPTTKKAPASVSAGQGPKSSLSQRARPERLELPTF